MTTPTVSRRAFLQASSALLLSRPRRGWSAGMPMQVEDWRGSPLGTKGVPSGWQRYETPGGHSAYDFTVVEDAGRRALHMMSAGEHSTIAKEVQAELTATPILAWQWHVLGLPQGADLRNRATSDAGGHIFAVWPRFPAFVRSRLIGYVWDPALPVGTVLPSRKTAAVTFIVARRGDQDLGQWLDEWRNIADDYRTVFGEGPPPLLPVVALSIDTNDTRSPAEVMFGRIELQSR